MIFSSKAAQRAQRIGAGLVFSATLALLAACGGSTSQYDPFEPQRVLAFGDENSALTPAGKRYGVNGLDANGNVDCAQMPIWVQTVADRYGFAFAECNPTGAEPRAKMFAAAGTKAGDLTAQVEAQVAAGGFRETDLALVLVGANDIIELYRQFPGRPEAELAIEAGARGRQLAQVVNRLVGLGAKVIVSTVPDMGLSPFAARERADNFDTDRSIVLTHLTAAFNEQLGVNVVLDGRYVGLMQSDVRFQAAYRLPSSVGLTNATTPVCTVAPPDCTTATLVDGASAPAYVWADDTRLAPGGQSQLATLALERATRNPF